MKPSSVSLPRAFFGPGYWLALAVLLLNDHVLKGAGVLPGWLTGKLSDFTGLWVAPPLLSALVLALVKDAAQSPKRQRAAAGFAVAAIGLGFAAIKLDAGAAQLAERLFSLFGVRSRIWVDPTDLWALGVLPFAFRAALPGARVFTQPFFQRAGIALAAFACIATTGGDDEAAAGSSAPTLLNDSEETLIVHIASTEGAGGCRIYREDRVGVLTPSAFTARRERVLKPGERASLVDTDADPSCGAAWVALPDGNEVIVYWRDLESIMTFAMEDARFEARRLILRGETNRFRFELGDDLNKLELSDEPLGGTCASDEPDYSLEASALAAAGGFYELGERMRDADDCLLIEWFAQSGDAAPDTQRLCIPDWAFPFEEGETLSVSEHQYGSGERRLRITRYEEEVLRLSLTVWNNATLLEESHAHALVAEDCVGELDACGAYLRPVQIELGGDLGVLVPGNEADLGEGNDDIRMLVGAGRDVGWSAPACSDELLRVGPTVNLLELRAD